MIDLGCIMAGNVEETVNATVESSRGGNEHQDGEEQD